MSGTPSLLELFITVFILAFSLMAIGMGLITARFGDDARRNLGMAYLFIGSIGLVCLFFFAGILPFQPPDMLFLGLDTVLTALVLIIAIIVGTVAGFILVFLTTLTAE